jgi:hypothetical protein
MKDREVKQFQYGDWYQREQGVPKGTVKEVEYGGTTSVYSFMKGLVKTRLLALLLESLMQEVCCGSGKNLHF